MIYKRHNLFKSADVSRINSLHKFDFDVRKWEILQPVKKQSAKKAVNKLKSFRIGKGEGAFISSFILLLVTC